MGPASFCFLRPGALPSFLPPNGAMPINLAYQLTFKVETWIKSISPQQRSRIAARKVTPSHPLHLSPLAAPIPKSLDQSDPNPLRLSERIPAYNPPHFPSPEKLQRYNPKHPPNRKPHLHPLREAASLLPYQGPFIKSYLVPHIATLENHSYPKLLLFFPDSKTGLLFLFLRAQSASSLGPPSLEYRVSILQLYLTPYSHTNRMENIKWGQGAYAHPSLPRKCVHLIQTPHPRAGKKPPLARS